MASKRERIRASREARKRRAQGPSLEALIMAGLLSVIFAISLGRMEPGEGLDGSQIGALLGIAGLLILAFR